MNEKEILQAAMYNSFDVITHKRTIEDIEYDGMPVFVHFPDRGIDKTSLKVMVMYFIMAEEYEMCKELTDEYEIIFNEKMPKILCECNTPKYHLLDDDTIECQNCKTQIV